MTTSSDETYRDGDLYKLLRAKFPAYRTSQKLFDVMAFANAVGVSRTSVYKWLHAGRLSQRSAMKIVDLAAGRVTKEQMFPFVMG